MCPDEMPTEYGHGAEIIDTPMLRAIAPLIVHVRGEFPDWSKITIQRRADNGIQVSVEQELAFSVDSQQDE